MEEGIKAWVARIHSKQDSASEGQDTSPGGTGEETSTRSQLSRPSMMPSQKSRLPSMQGQTNAYEQNCPVQLSSKPPYWKSKSRTYEGNELAFLRYIHQRRRMYTRDLWTWKSSSRLSLSPGCRTTCRISRTSPCLGAARAQPVTIETRV